MKWNTVIKSQPFTFASLLLTAVETVDTEVDLDTGPGSRFEQPNSSCRAVWKSLYRNKYTKGFTVQFTKMIVQPNLKYALFQFTSNPIKYIKYWTWFWVQQARKQTATIIKVFNVFLFAKTYIFLCLISISPLPSFKLLELRSNFLESM